MALSKLRSLDEDKRKELLERNMQHLNLVDRERQFYKTNIDHAKESVENAYNSTPTLNKSTPCTFSGTNHYSFDYFQQVHIPWDPDQVGALYFLTPYKIGLFGVMCEPLSKMALFIIPEGSATGKGSNQVISMLHYYFQNLGLGETEAILNADNCVGQNKNQLCTCTYKVLLTCFRTVKFNQIRKPADYSAWHPISEIPIGKINSRLNKGTVQHCGELIFREHREAIKDAVNHLKDWLETQPASVLTRGKQTYDPSVDANLPAPQAYLNHVNTIKATLGRDLPNTYRELIYQTTSLLENPQVVQANTWTNEQAYIYIYMLEGHGRAA